ncbi:MAG: hypothetical protein NZ555_04915 [Geminicoccaceae bacterium]|nr:hypothetical protein [Geminicoccaceae bacterium]MCX8102336.1 hypothetical protein [Geminicoccaceae bacterium]
MRRTSRHPSMLGILALSLLLAACAETAGSVRPLGPEPATVELAGYRKLVLATSASPAVALTEDDLQRISRLILTKLHEQAPGRFESFDVRVSPSIVVGAVRPSEPQAGAGAAEPGLLGAELAITRYERGSAFARMMLAGLGQIHIDGELALVDRASGRELARKIVSKTFAWGGLYGGLTDIRDVEEGFAAAVASAILGR